jgi:membrane protein implicated in regulation of membrane protease activity
MDLNIGDIIFQLIVFSLIVLFFVSIGAFFRSLFKNQRTNVQQNSQIEQKLDRIIELLEKEKK